MAVEWLAGKRARGTSSERTGLGTIVTTTNTTVSKTGCKAYYNFEQTSGNLINQATTANGFTDGIGSNGDLTTSGSITKNATGKLDTYSWDFTSTNGYAEETTTNTLSSTFSAWTLSLWCKPASVRASYMFGLTNNDGNTNNFQFIMTTAGGKFQGVVGSNSNQQAIVSTSSYSTSVWQMVTVVYDGSLSGTDRLKIYFNGTSEGTASGTPDASYTLNSYPDVGRQGNSGQTYYTGLTDEASIWNRALTSSEISTLYNEQEIGIFNIQDGTIFEETDTNKAYIWNASTTTWTQL